MMRHNWLRAGTLILVAAILWYAFQGRDVEMPEHFSPYLEIEDRRGASRLRAMEEGSVYRCYEEEDGSLTVIQSVEAYEEPMLIRTQLNGQMVLAVDVLYENETDDYGSYVVEDWFLDRLLLTTEDKLKTVKRKREKNNEVIAITGATITSDAVVLAVNRSMEKWEEYQK